MLSELLRRAAGAAPDLPAVIAGHGSVSYGECHERCQAFARGLSRRRIERFGCTVRSPADVLIVLAGSSAVGAEACLYPPDLDAAGVSRIAARFRHSLVITDGDHKPGGVQVLTVPQLEGSGEPRVSAPPVPVSAYAPVLVLTTGTTGEQKGARHDWARLARSVRHPDERSGTRWLLAFNLNQFAGVQIVLQILTSRGTLVVPRSRRPEDVIDCIRAHRVTHVSATPTFWRLVVGRLNADVVAELPLQQITLGGEAAPDGLIRKLRTLFPLARLSQVYAGTEFGSAVSVRDGHSGLPLSVLDRDEGADVRLRIVDGELQVSSRLGMLGYHEHNDDDAEWRATGDLVEVRSDRIHFVGRSSEMINVGGAKVHPLPVEETICSVEGVELAAVYGRPNPVTGQIVAADVVPASHINTHELESRIRIACEALPAAGRPRRIRFVDELAMVGNKLVRREARIKR